MNGSPSWDGLRLFLTVVERRSLSAGARALGISQPTATRRIAELEQALGARLLLRQSRGVVPTPAGEEVLAEARRMAEGANAALRRASGDGATPVARTIRIAATEGLGCIWLPRHLASLRAQLPGLRVEILVDNAAADLGARQADIAVRLFRPRQPDLVARKVATLGFGFFASPAYLAERGTPRRLEDLRAHDHVGYMETGTLAPPYIRWLRRQIPPERFVAAASSLLAVAELARRGHGLVLGTTGLLFDDRQLVRVLPRLEVPSLDVWLTTHTDVRKDPMVAATLGALTALFVREASVLAS
jgi:DNA-binding transcriptional LysR family regulator